MRKKLRIIIPCWPSFERAAQSCLRQSLNGLKSDRVDITVVSSKHCFLSTARNSGIDNAESTKKRRDTFDSDYYLFVDADTGFTIDNIHALLDVNVPVIGGAYKYRTGENEGKIVGGYWKKELPGINESCVDSTETGLVKVDWCGAGFLLVQVDVFEQIEYPWFYCGVIEHGDEAIEHGEDIGFSLKCRKAGVPIVLHCGLKPELIHKQDTEQITSLKGENMDNLEQLKTNFISAELELRRNIGRSVEVLCGAANACIIEMQKRIDEQQRQLDVIRKPEKTE